MFINYFNIEQLKKNQYKDIVYFKNNKKLYCYILYSKKEIEENENLEFVEADVLSYGENFSRVITNFQTLKFLALNPDENMIEPVIIKDGIIKRINKFTSFCFVEKKTKYYKLYWDFDFKYEKEPEIYNGFIGQHDFITEYILKYIIDTLNETLNLSKTDLQYIWAQKEKNVGFHIYFPNIIVDKELHLWIYEKTFEKILNDKKYPEKLISKIFDKCIQSNGLRLFYYKYENDFYFPFQEKSTFKFEPEPDKHFHLCIINTNYDAYNFNLKIHSDLIWKNVFIEDKKIETKSIESNTIVDIKTINIEDKKDLIIGLSLCLDNKRIDEYHNWISLIYMFKNFGMYEEIINLSKKSKKFYGITKNDNLTQKQKDINASKNIQIIDKIFKNKTTPRNVKIITIGTLIEWAKADNLELTNKVFSKYFLSMKLDIKHINEITQSRYKINVDFEENEKIISIEAHNFFINSIDKSIDTQENLCDKFSGAPQNCQSILKGDKTCIILQSGTGTGKTYTINKINNQLLKSNPHYTFLSLVTRRSMCACHINAFNNCADSKIKFTSYLDNSYETLDYFISSLENLIRVHDNYDIVLLDEVNSLINYFYSDTLSSIRLRCIGVLFRLLSKAKVIIACDANITDLVFGFFNQINIKYLYYKNNYKNKVGIPFDFYLSKNYNIMANLFSFCDKFIIEKIKKGDSVLILTDSFTITNELKNYLLKYNDNHDYFRVFNKDEGTLDDIVNINKICVGRCVLANSKILYGVDLQFHYNVSFFIYKYASSFGIDAFCMEQQIGRPRNTDKLQLLCLDPKALFYSNTFISFDENKQRQQKFIQTRNNLHKELCKKYSVIDEMGIVDLDWDGNNKFNLNSVMTEIHYIKTWYDSLFYNNKIEILKLIAEKSYGYKINTWEWMPDDKYYNFGKKFIGVKDIINVSKLIYQGNEKLIEPKYIHCIDNLKEQIKQRQKYLHNIEDVELFEELACNEDKFKQYLYKKYLVLDKTQFDKKVIELKNKDLEIIKPDELIDKINTCFWFEGILNIKRFNVNDIKDIDIENIKKIFIKEIDKFYYIFKNTMIKSKNVLIIKKKIYEISNLNLLQKFIAECYNHISNNTIKVISKQKKVKNVLKLYYIFENLH